MVDKPKLTIELVPATCWGRNVRSLVSSHVWNDLRHRVYREYGNVCGICGKGGVTLHCHEMWNYDISAAGIPVQRLVRLIALCKWCHEVKHAGRAESQGRLPNVLRHLMRINKWTQEQAEEHLIECGDVFAARSELDWVLDISYLDTYGVAYASLPKFEDDPDNELTMTKGTLTIRLNPEANEYER